MDVDSIYKLMHGYTRFDDVAHVVSGYYMMLSPVFTFKMRKYGGLPIDEYYSALLGKFVPIESEAVRPMIPSSEVKNYWDAHEWMPSTYVLVADYKDSVFAYKYPYAAAYLRECCEYEKVTQTLRNEVFIRGGLRSIMDAPKVLISTSGDVCHAMLDDDVHLVSSAQTYMCALPRSIVRKNLAFVALLNSKLFSYLFYHESQKPKNPRHGRMGVLRSMPIPYSSERGYSILESLAECLVYLSRPELPQISEWVSNDRLKYYLTEIMDMVVYEMYFEQYMYEHNLDVISYMLTAPFMYTLMSIEDKISQTYIWYQSSQNAVRQKVDLLDTRSPELLYVIHNFKPDE